jgi:hypothetical protein
VAGDGRRVARDSDWIVAFSHDRIGPRLIGRRSWLAIGGFPLERGDLEDSITRGCDRPLDPT